jgi:hypothetical protein
MGMWGGDPVLAMAYLDGFIRADRAVTVAVNQIFYTLNKELGKKA